MTDPAPRRVFVQDDLSAYERVNAEEFPNYDDVDSRLIVDDGAPDQEARRGDPD